MCGGSSSVSLANLVSVGPPTDNSMQDQQQQDPKRSTICAVCGVDTGNFNLNYGANTCLSCRAFFRRAVQRGRGADDYACKGDPPGSCAITAANRSCKACRYAACAAAGMRADAVMKSGQVKHRFAKFIQRKAGVDKKATTMSALTDIKRNTINKRKRRKYFRGAKDSSATVSYPGSSNSSSNMEAAPVVSSTSEGFGQFSPFGEGPSTSISACQSGNDDADVLNVLFGFDVAPTASGGVNLQQPATPLVVADILNLNDEGDIVDRGMMQVQQVGSDGAVSNWLDALPDVLLEDVMNETNNPVLTKDSASGLCSSGYGVDGNDDDDTWVADQISDFDLVSDCISLGANMVGECATVGTASSRHLVPRVAYVAMERVRAAMAHHQELSGLMASADEDKKRKAMEAAARAGASVVLAKLENARCASEQFRLAFGAEDKTVLAGMFRSVASIPRSCPISVAAWNARHGALDAAAAAEFARLTLPGSALARAVANSDAGYKATVLLAAFAAGAAHHPPLSTITKRYFRAAVRALPGTAVAAAEAEVRSVVMDVCHILSPIVITLAKFR